MDEIQDADATHRKMLTMLQAGVPGLPLVPACTDLGNSLGVLTGSECGLSRFGKGNNLTIDGLALEEAADAVGMYLDHFRIDTTGADAETWCRELAERSDGWPQHLHTAMQGLAEGLIATKGKLADFSRTVFRERGRDFRRDSYRARQSDEMFASRTLVGRLMEFVPDDAGSGVARDEVIDQIAVLDGAGGIDRRHRAPEDMSAERFMDHLIRKGALQPDASGRLYCPIPSFRRWLIEQGQ